MWETSLRSGMVGLTGAPVLADSDMRVVWYADVLDSQSGASCAFPADDRRARRVMGGDEGLQILTSGMGNVIGILGGIFGDGQVDTELRDAAGDMQFLGDAGKRCAAERRLTDALDAARRARRPVVLVAHSFGSIVAYDALTARDSAQEPTIARLVTIGAVVGSPTLRRIIFGESEASALRLPPGVQSWVNVRNPGDPLAAPLEPLPHDTSASIRDVPTSTNNDDADTHEMVGYLRDTVTARAVLGAWCATIRPSSARPRGCR